MHAFWRSSPIPTCDSSVDSKKNQVARLDEVEMSTSMKEKVRPVKLKQLKKEISEILQNLQNVVKMFGKRKREEIIFIEGIIQQLQSAYQHLQTANPMNESRSTK